MALISQRFGDECLMITLTQRRQTAIHIAKLTMTNVEGWVEGRDAFIEAII